MVKSVICLNGHKIDLPSEYALASVDSPGCLKSIFTCEVCEHLIEVRLLEIKQPDASIPSKKLTVNKEALVLEYHVIKLPYSLDPASKGDPGAYKKQFTCEKCNESVDVCVKEHADIVGPLNEPPITSQGPDTGYGADIIDRYEYPGLVPINRYPGLDSVVRYPGLDPVVRNHGPGLLIRHPGNEYNYIGVGLR